MSYLFKKNEVVRIKADPYEVWFCTDFLGDGMVALSNVGMKDRKTVMYYRRLKPVEKLYHLNPVHSDCCFIEDGRVFFNTKNFENGDQVRVKGGTRTYKVYDRCENHPEEMILVCNGDLVVYHKDKLELL